MKVFGIIGYHLVFLSYYTVCVAVLLALCYSPSDDVIGPIAPFLRISILVSPFFITRVIISKLYYGNKKSKHANSWAIGLTVFTTLYIIGVATTSREFSAIDTAFIGFNVCFIISLFTSASKSRPNIIDERGNLSEQIECNELLNRSNEIATGETNTLKPRRQESEKTITAKESNVSTNVKKIADKIRGLKSNRNSLYGGLQGVATAVYDGALEIAATVIENGGKLIDAVRAAILHIKENSDEKDDDKIYVTLIKDLSDAGVMDYINEVHDSGIPSSPPLLSESKTNNKILTETKEIPPRPNVNYPVIGSLFIKVSLISLYLCCLFNMPYSYYQIVKFTSLLLFTGLLIIDYGRKKYLFLPLSVIGIVIFNPIYKVLLGRDNWQTIDKGLAVLLTIWIALDLIFMVKFTERKKLIAREILTLLSAIGISVLCLAGTFVYNFYINHRIGNLKDKISAIQNQFDDLNSVFDYKQRNHQWFFDSMSNEFNLQKNNLNNEENLWNYTTKAKFWKSIDSVNLRWNSTWLKNGVEKHFENIGFSNPQKLYYFINEKTISPSDSLNHKKAVAIQRDIENVNTKIAETHDSKLDFSDQVKFAFLSLVILVLMLFGLRYLYYLVKWCISTLKTN